MSSKRYAPEFRAEAIKQITERGYSVADVSRRLGVSTHSLYSWLRDSGVSRKEKQAKDYNELQLENARLKAELARVEEERAILEKAAAYFAKASG